MFLHKIQQFISNYAPNNSHTDCLHEARCGTSNFTKCLSIGLNERAFFFLVANKNCSKLPVWMVLNTNRWTVIIYFSNLCCIWESKSAVLNTLIYTKIIKSVGKRLLSSVQMINIIANKVACWGSICGQQLIIVIYGPISIKTKATSSHTTLISMSITPVKDSVDTS